jgi:hypothetical protein
VALVRITLRTFWKSSSRSVEPTSCGAAAREMRGNPDREYDRSSQ